MALDHEAIYKAYAGTVVSIDDSAGAFDASGASVSLDQSKIISIIYSTIIVKSY